MELIEKYKSAISAKIRRYIDLPKNIVGNPEVIFQVTLLPDGHILGVQLAQTSGNAAYDQAVERAINKAQPLPMPPDPTLFRDFRQLSIRFRSRE